ncbi:MAG: diacylglycerol/lipid kinase family protein, partial [Betaproteobacteria bacterium]
MPQPPAAPVDSPAIFVVLNAASGSDSVDQTRETIAAVLESAGCRHRIFVAGRDGSPGQLAVQAVALARSTGAGAVVAAGGDGTINTVAQAVLDADPTLGFGVIAQGTFNYFARVHSLPLEPEAATRLLLTGRPQPVQIGLVNERVFLVNASLGLYPALLEDREAWKRKLGRSRPVAFLAGLLSLLGEHRQLHIGLECDGV